MVAAMSQQWKTITTGNGLSLQIIAIPTVAVFAWIAKQRGDPAVLTYILITSPLVSIWNGAVFRVGWTLSSELSNQTLHFVYISRTPVVLVSIGKALAQTAWGLPTGVIAFAVVWLITGTSPQVANGALLGASMVFVLLALLVASLFFSPLNVLVGGRGGFFNAILPFGVLLSGYVFPVDRLPLALEIPARLLPMSWSMDVVWLAVQGTESWTRALLPWAMCLVTSAAVFGITCALFRVVERRIRVTGTLELRS